MSGQPQKCRFHIRSGAQACLSLPGMDRSQFSALKEISNEIARTRPVDATYALAFGSWAIGERRAHPAAGESSPFPGSASFEREMLRAIAAHPQLEIAERAGGNGAAAAITATEISELLDRALDTHGSHAYQDKGAAEVMDVDAILRRFEGLSGTQISATLVEILERRPNEAPAKGAEPLLTALVHGLDDHPDFDEILADERVGRCY